MLPPDSRQISVQVSGDDYRILERLVKEARTTQPGYSFGDLLREFIHECLAGKNVKPPDELSAAEERVRRLRAIALSVRHLARELEEGIPK